VRGERFASVEVDSDGVVELQSSGCDAIKKLVRVNKTPSRDSVLRLLFRRPALILSSLFYLSAFHMRHHLLVYGIFTL
jgi:hypothetical protein